MFTLRDTGPHLTIDLKEPLLRADPPMLDVLVRLPPDSNNAPSGTRPPFRIFLSLSVYAQSPSWLLISPRDCSCTAAVEQLIYPLKVATDKHLCHIITIHPLATTAARSSANTNRTAHLRLHVGQRVSLSPSVVLLAVTTR